MPWIDGHLDLAYLAVNGRDLRGRCADPALGCISLPELREAEVRLAFGTIFTELAGAGPPSLQSPAHAPHVYRDHDDLEGAHRAGMLQLELYEHLEREGWLRIVRSQRDLDFDLNDDGPLRIMILMEGADPIRSPDELPIWFDRGVRMIGMTWAMGSRYAGGNERTGPLTAIGIELAHAMDELGVIHDVSHLADEAFEQLLNISRGPIAASHSNARRLATPSQRHLTDEQIRQIGNRGGVIGLNLYRRFLSPTRDGTLADVVRHAQHITTVMGHFDGIALGSDADGGFPPAQLATDLEHPSRWSALADALLAAGWSDEQVRGLQCENWLRFLRSSLRGVK